MAAKGPKLKVAQFDLHGDRLDLGKRWEKWVDRFERDLKYNGIDPSVTGNATTAQMALLIYAGAEVEEIHDTLPTSVKPEGVADDDWTEYKKSKEKLTAYFSPKQCNDFALFQMMNLKTAPGQGIPDYATKL